MKSSNDNNSNNQQQQPQQPTTHDRQQTKTTTTTTPTTTPTPTTTTTNQEKKEKIKKKNNQQPKQPTTTMPFICLRGQQTMYGDDQCTMSQTLSRYTYSYERPQIAVASLDRIGKSVPVPLLEITSLSASRTLAGNHITLCKQNM